MRLFFCIRERIFLSHPLMRIIRDVARVKQQLAERGSPVEYAPHSIGAGHWLSRLKGGSKGGGMQLGFDVMQRLLLSPPKVPLPPITKDLASMLHLGLTDESSIFAEASLSHAPDQTCFARAFSFNACPINGSVRSAIMQDAPLLYYYILCSQMQATPPSSYPESKLNHCLQSFCRPSASRALWSTCSSIHAHNAPSIFSQLLSSLIPIMSQNRMCKIIGPHGSGKTTLLQCYAKHVASSHAQVLYCHPYHR
jgi:hypothetical protein